MACVTEPFGLFAKSAIPLRWPVLSILSASAAGSVQRRIGECQWFIRRTAGEHYDGARTLPIGALVPEIVDSAIQRDTAATFPAFSR